MVTNKFSKSLQQHLEKKQFSIIEVIVELQNSPGISTSSLTKQEKIKNIKQSFNEQLATISNVLEDTGGAIIDTAWINKTIKLKIPVQGLNKLANVQSVEIIDLSQKLKKD